MNRTELAPYRTDYRNFFFWVFLVMLGLTLDLDLAALFSFTAKVNPSTTKKTQKKKILKSVLDGATSVLFTLLCLAPGMIGMAWCGSGF